MRKNIIKIISFFVLFILFVFPVLNNSTVLADNPFGTIDAPEYINTVGDLKDGGVVKIMNNILKTAMVIAGLWSFINLIIAGFTYITSGDNPEEITKAGQRIYMSIIGLVIVVGSFTLAAIIGWIIYKDASAILSPKIYGIGE